MDWNEEKISILLGRLSLVAEMTTGRVSETVEESINAIRYLSSTAKSVTNRSDEYMHSDQAVEDIMMRNQLLIQERETLTHERDEARSTLCEKIAYNIDISGRTPSEIAEEMGWGYLRWSR